MENDKHPQNIRERNLKNKSTLADTFESNFEKPTTPSKRKPKQQVKKSRKRDRIKEKISSINIINSDAFVFDEIANNKEASDLITDLVKCYTCNSSLSKDELELLNKTLHQRTISVFLNILNHCIEKIFNKLLNMEFFKDLISKKQVLKKNAYCQTDEYFNTH